MKSTVDQINNCAKQIANVNQQITKLKRAPVLAVDPKIIYWISAISWSVN